MGFCSGNYGDAIFTETFGTGTENGPPLPPGTTTYPYVDGAPPDGTYTISSRTDYYQVWFDTTDHTGDTNGKLLIVNASVTPGEFFRRTVSGLCENTSYEFSSWIMNLVSGTSTGCGLQGGIPVNLKFEVWDNTDTQLLATGDTGDIFAKASPTWEQYALVFRTLPGQTSVILKMRNNGVGGCGNDVGIDDIVFKSCGDTVLLTDSTNSTSITVCESQAPITPTLTAHPDFSTFKTHAYQWQESADGTTWNDLVGETTPIFTTPQLNTATFYRVKVAEDAINLANLRCSVFSNVFDVTIVAIPDAPVSQGDVELCVDNPRGVQVSVPNDVLVNWYDAPTGGNLLAGDSELYATTISGTYYAEAVSKTTNCSSNTRTAVSIVYLDLSSHESLTFCEGQSVTLSGDDVTNASYLWSTGETTKEIVVTSPGTYTVAVTKGNGCSTTKTIQLSQIDHPILDKVVSDHRDLTILTLNSGDFEYSLDGLAYQETSLFENQQGGVYNAFVRGKGGCGLVQLQFVHIVVPRFFTPNGDGINDSFSLEGVEFVDAFKISIFDRTSKPLFQSTDKNFSWDGVFNNRPLPASSYWYRIEIGQNVLKGHVVLKHN
ncbi:hypothetical protein FGF1_02850 [Flavobacteriaceae bacterium GF1]